MVALGAVKDAYVKGGGGGDSIVDGGTAAVGTADRKR